MFSRSMRAETRNRAKDEWKRAVHSIDKVRKWEKKWVVVKDTTMKIYKWVPIKERDVGRRTKKVFSKAEVENDENSNITKVTEDTENSQEPFPNREASNDGSFPSRLSTQPTDFAALNEDSNTGFSEGGFDSDSNQAFPGRNFITPSVVGEESTDFSSLAAEEESRDEASTFPTTHEADDTISYETPPSKRLKHI